jgi:hypothetical protein
MYLIDVILLQQARSIIHVALKKMGTSIWDVHRKEDRDKGLIRKAPKKLKPPPPPPTEEEVKKKEDAKKRPWYGIISGTFREHYGTFGEHRGTCGEDRGTTGNFSHMGDICGTHCIWETYGSVVKCFTDGVPSGTLLLNRVFNCSQTKVLPYV